LIVHEHPVSEIVKAVGDVISITALVGALVQWLPALASLLTITWTVIRIYETDTVQRWLGRR
jgi:hypothetical protein